MYLPAIGAPSKRAARTGMRLQPLALSAVVMLPSGSGGTATRSSTPPAEAAPRTSYWTERPRVQGAAGTLSAAPTINGLTIGGALRSLSWSSCGIEKPAALMLSSVLRLQ